MLDHILLAEQVYFTKVSKQVEWWIYYKTFKVKHWIINPKEYLITIFF